MSNYGDYYVAGIPFNGENALKHHGILGQKWGVRRYQNLDGTLTAEGRARYGSKGEQKKLAKKLTSKHGGYNSSASMKTMNRNAISSTPQVKYAVQQVKELSKKQIAAHEEFQKVLDRDFYNNKEVHDEWVNKAVDKYMQKYGDTLSNLSYWNQLPQWLREMQPRDFVKWMYEHDDWDQGDCGSLEMFLDSNDPRNRNINKAFQALSAADKDMANATRQLVNEFLGDYANDKVRGGDITTTAGLRLSRIIADDARYENQSISGRLAMPKGNY